MVEDRLGHPGGVSTSRMVPNTSVNQSQSAKKLADGPGTPNSVRCTGLDVPQDEEIDEITKPPELAKPELANAMGGLDLHVLIVPLH
jgi:hypothetical protein